MIAFLRFIGLVNAAIWLGAAVFFTVGAEAACVSTAAEKLLGESNFPFFSGALAQIVMARYFAFLCACAVIALLHLLAEWLYMGRPTRKLALALLSGLLLLVLAGGLWIEPHLESLHVRHYTPNAPAVERAAAARSFRFWHAGFEVFNVALIAGLVVYVWRVANPTDAPRFISSVKFRG